MQSHPTGVPTTSSQRSPLERRSTLESPLTAPSLRSCLNRHEGRLFYLAGAASTRLQAELNRSRVIPLKLSAAMNRIRLEAVRSFVRRSTALGFASRAASGLSTRGQIGVPICCVRVAASTPLAGVPPTWRVRHARGPIAFARRPAVHGGDFVAVARPAYALGSVRAEYGPQCREYAAPAGSTRPPPPTACRDRATARRIRRPASMPADFKSSGHNINRMRAAIKPLSSGPAYSRPSENKSRSPRYPKSKPRPPQC